VSSQDVRIMSLVPLATSVKISKYYFRGRKRKGGKTRKSVNLSINSKDGIHPGRLLSLAITKHILLDTYTECFDIIQESEIVQIRVDNNGQSISLIAAFWYLLTIFMALLYWSTMWSTVLLFLYFNSY
jgi:hypothetical protein